MPLSIDAAFNGGNIRVIEIRDYAVDLAIRNDGYSAFYQWFFFRLAGVARRTTKLRIINAGGAAFPTGWQDYKVHASTDRSACRMTTNPKEEYPEGSIRNSWAMLPQSDHRLL